MNKLFTKIAAFALGSSMAIGVGVAVAGNSKEATSVHAATNTVSFVAGKDKGSTTGTGADSVTKSGIEISSTSAAFGRTDEYRLYASSTTTFTSSVGNITEIYFKSGSSLGNIALKSGESGTYNSNTKKWSGSATSVKFTHSAQAKPTAIDVTHNVAAKTLSSIALSGTYPTTFTQGDSFSHSGMTVTATYSDSTTADVTSSATFSDYNMSTTGNQTVTVSYTEGGTTKTATYGITVNAPTPVIGTPPYSANFLSLTSYGYTQNKVITLSEKDWITSVSQFNNSAFWLGTNGNNASKGVLQDNSTFSSEVTALKAVDSAYNSSYSTAHAYALRFDNAYDGVGHIEFNWSTANNAFQVYLFGDKGSGYVLLNSVNYSDTSVAGSLKWDCQTGTDDFKKITLIARPGASGSTATSKTIKITSFSLTDTPESVATKLETPVPIYDDTLKQVSFSVEHASSYQLKVDTGSYSAATSPYSVGSLSTGVEHTVYVIAKGDGVDYSDSDEGSVTFTPSAVYHVTYNGNGNTGGEVPTDGTSYANGASVTVSGNTGSLVKVHDNPSFSYTFGGWTINSDGSGTVYGPGAGQTSTYTISSNNVTFYAKWVDPRTNVTLSASNIEMEVGDADATPTITSNPSGHTSGYTLTSENEGVATIVDNKVHAVAKGTATINVQIADDSSYKYTGTSFTVTVSKTMDDNGTGTINFGSAVGSTKVNASSVTGDDSQGNTWTVTTTGTTSYSQNSAYSQIGKNGEAASSITFTVSLSKNVRITHFSANFGGFTSTVGDIVLSVGSTPVANGNLNGTSDVTIGGDITDTNGNALTIAVGNNVAIDRGVKVYSISYTYITVVPVTSVELSSSELNLVPGGIHQLTATVYPENANNKNVTFTSSANDVVTVSSTGLVTAVADGTATITVTTADGGHTATCTVHVETPADAYVNIASETAIGIVAGETQDINFTYGGAFSGSLGVTKSNSNINVSLIDNGNGTGKVTISFVSPGTSIISFTDGGEPIENDGSSCTVTVVERLNGIDAYDETLSDMTFTTAYGEGGESATATDGTVWTVTSDAEEQNYASDGIHYGSGNKKVQYVQLITPDVVGTIKEVVVTCRDAKSSGRATISVSLGSGSLTCTGSTTAETTSSSFTFIGTGSGDITVRIDRGSASTDAIYVKSVKVKYLSNTSTPIANTNAVVQKEVLDFVSIMNQDLAVCSSGTISDSVWTSLAEKYEVAKNNSTDSELFEQMFRYATSTERAGDGSATTGDSLQNALARYDYILMKYNTIQSVKYADFLGRVYSGKITYNAARAGLINFIVDVNNASSIIVVLAMMSLTVYGGYFFLRKKKEQ